MRIFYGLLYWVYIVLSIIYIINIYLSCGSLWFLGMVYSKIIMVMKYEKRNIQNSLLVIILSIVSFGILMLKIYKIKPVQIIKTKE